MLHILNGDATAAVFATAGVPGDSLVWRDILVEGPVAPDMSLAERAAYLGGRLGIDAGDYIRTVEAQGASLAAAAGQDEIVLWFEQDLFCAVTLWSLLEALTRRAPATRLSLVYPACEGKIRGLGSMTAAQLTALFTQRHPVTPAVRAAGAQAWAAYAASDPPATAAWAGREALPFVDGAFRCHLGRFPSLATGLNEVETAALEALAQGPRRFGPLFRAVGDDPRVRRHGMGDVQLAAYLRGLTPLVSLGGDEWSITSRGQAVLAGAEDRLDIATLDTWLGGVHLAPDRPPWRWDGARLVASSRGV
jgi:hypothetical protein